MDLDDIISFMILSALFILSIAICIIVGFGVSDYYSDKNVICNDIKYEKVKHVNLNESIFKFYNPEEKETLFFNAADCKIVSN